MTSRNRRFGVVHRLFFTFPPSRAGRFLVLLRSCGISVLLLLVKRTCAEIDRFGYPRCRGFTGVPRALAVRSFTWRRMVIAETVGGIFLDRAKTHGSERRPSEKGEKRRGRQKDNGKAQRGARPDKLQPAPALRASSVERTNNRKRVDDADGISAVN